MEWRKQILSSVASLLVCGFATAQSSHNYIRTDVMLDSAGASRMTTVKYYDGLGRLEQTVAVGASPSGADLVMHSSRDRAGRIVQRFAATPSAGGGAYVDGTRIRALSAEAYGDSSPYTLTEYEQSPLGRQVAATGAGQAWHSTGKSTRMAYSTNSASGSGLKCRLFSVSDTRCCTDTVVTLTTNGFYPAGELLVTRTEDEDGRVSLVFTDKQGRTVLTRSLTDGRHADTYYVYDIAGNLTAVFPPAFSAKVGSGKISSTSTDARDFAYFYIYDWFGRCRAKKLPGRDWQITAYDKAGKALMTQDGNMRKRGEAVFTLSDAFGRECVTGVAKQMLSVADANMDVSVLARRSVATDSLGGYEIMNNAITLPSDNLLSVTYYDDYSFLDGKAFGKELAYRDAAGYDRRYECADYPALSAKGLLTGTATRILGDSAMLYKSVYYDYHGNVIQSHEQNAMGGYDHYYYRLTFTGKPIVLMHKHSTADTSNEYVYSYTYDNMERLLSVCVTKDGGNPATLARNTYDVFGRLQKQSHGQSLEGSVQFGYNVRGWISRITNPHFSQKLYYESKFGNSTPCWGGNISAIEWMSKDNLISSGIVEQAYKFYYDGLDRLVAADYASPVVPVPDTSAGLVLLNERDYSCAYSYDLNGNITSLRRKGVSDVVTADDKILWTFGDVDDLTLTYNGNQLRKAVDQVDELTYSGAMDFKDHADKATEYAYDANGNMTQDKNRRIYSISYNILNLPDEVRFYDGHINRYTYDATGTKLKVEYLLSNERFMDWDIADPIIKVPDVLNVAERKGISIGDIAIPPGSEIILKPVTQMTLQYSAGHVYRNGTLERVNNSFGYWADSSFHYNILDYQGNVRAVIAEDGTLEEVNNYYPYGGLMGAANAGVQPLKYGAKELDRENGLDLYDSKARFYDAMIGRTPTQDPLAEKYSCVSPYLWCAANPNRFIDEKGDSIAVLYLHGIVGHLALLIQNDNGKWAYYSMNGNNIYTSTKGSAGGKGYHDLGTKTFDSPMAFLNSSYNQEGKNKRDIQNDKVNNYGYEEAFVIPTTQKQDKKIREKFLSETHQSYNLVNRQCAQVVQKALNAAGIETNSSEMSYYDDMFLPDSTPYLPARTFIAIRYNNPKGIYIRKK